MKYLLPRLIFWGKGKANHAVDDPGVKKNPVDIKGGLL